jgi:hypothetical protein
MLLIYLTCNSGIYWNKEIMSSITRLKVDIIYIDFISIIHLQNFSNPP